MGNTAKKKPETPAKAVPNRPPKGATVEQKRDWARKFIMSRVPPGVSLVDELLADRRREAGRD